MSNEQVIGHVGWSPDFESQPNKIERLLKSGSIKFAPLFRDGKLISVDLVANKNSDMFAPVDLDVEEVAAELRPHKPESPVTLIGASADCPEMMFTYTNWKGETSERRALFTALQFGATEYHPEPQLLIHGYDLDKNAPRTYAVKDMHNIRPTSA